jgi:hypothetical protein
VGEPDESAVFDVPIAASVLREGTNVLAVEVHQWTPASTDIGFDLELIGSAAGAAVVRGPYLQSVTPTSAVVRWRTDVPTDTRLWAGYSSGLLFAVHEDATPRTEHEALVTGLPSGTRFHYAIGETSGILAGGDGAHTLATAPPAGSSEPTRVWVIGDSGTGTAIPAVVMDAYLTHSAGEPTDVWLMLGDNAYPSGTDAEYQVALFETFAPMLRDTCLWPTLGNHDALSASSPAESGVYYDVFTLPRGGEAGGLPSGTEAYYSFDHGDIHFVCLDSHDTDRSQAGAMATWLAADLAATEARWLVAFWHHPPYSKGSHDSDDPLDSGGRMQDMREVLVPILEAGGVDLVLCGHSHAYERSYLLDGHHGTSDTLDASMVLDAGDGRASGDGTYAKPSPGLAAHEGAVYAVAGHGSLLGGGVLDHPAMHFAINMWGSMVIEVDGDRLDGYMLDALGEVHDPFTIEKGLDRSLLRDAPRISLAAGGSQGLRLEPGSAHAGDLYLVLGSFGTSPGFQLEGAHVPLNPDVWMSLTIDLANTGLFQGTLGLLNEDGEASAAIALSPLGNPSFAGAVMHHAFIVHDGASWVLASNSVKLTLEP